MLDAAASSSAPLLQRAGTRRADPGRWLWAGVSVALAGVAALFFGINDYSAASTALTGTAQRSSQRFEAVYADAVENRLSALRLGVDLVTANPLLTGALARDDRPALMQAAVPLYAEVLQPRYGVNQFNFWTPPAKLYLRANAPAEFGTDGSAARRSIVQAIERRAAISGMETGLGGRLGIRAIAPILDGTRLVGVVELGDDLVAILRRARAATGVEFAAGLDRKRSDEVERVAKKDTDSVQGTDVFFEYSSEAVGRLVRSLSFNARDPAGDLIQADGRAVFVRPFIVTNFAGAPTVVVATVFDLTQQFADARQSAVVKSGLLFVVLSVAAVAGLLQFQKIQQGFARVVFGERRKLQETTQALAAAREALRDVDLVKQGFFTNMIAAVSEPLQAVHGQLQASIPNVEAALGDLPGHQAVSDRLSFSLDEIGRLTRLVGDYRQVQLFRHNLAPDRAGTASLSQVVSAVLGAELARFARLPQLAISAAVPEGLPPVRASVDLLRQALAGLVTYGAEYGGRGSIHIAGSVDEGGWVRLVIAGSAFAAAGDAMDALLNDSRQFIARLNAPARPADAGGTMMSLILARTIIENAGGRLDAAEPAEAGPGFVALLPAAV